jgi:hypothetical protein
VDHHLLVRRLAHRRGLRRFRHRDPLASTIERRGPSLARSVRWLPCRSRRSRDTRSARFALCPTRRASSPFSFRDGCRSDNGQNETRRIANLGRPPCHACRFRFFTGRRRPKDTMGSKSETQALADARAHARRRGTRLTTLA